jgi:small Trp-rich protein
MAFLGCRMWFLIGGLVLLGLWMAEIGPVAQLHWGWVMLPFVLAAVWWAIADSTGLTKQREERKMEERKVARRQRDMEALGLNVRREKRVRVIRDAARRATAQAAADAPPPPAKPDDPPRRDPRP